MDNKLKYRILYWIPGKREDVLFDDWNTAVDAKIALMKVHPDYIFKLEEVVE